MLPTWQPIKHSILQTCWNKMTFLESRNYSFIGFFNFWKFDWRVQKWTWIQMVEYINGDKQCDWIEKGHNLFGDTESHHHVRQIVYSDVMVTSLWWRHSEIQNRNGLKVDVLDGGNTRCSSSKTTPIDKSGKENHCSDKKLLKTQNYNLSFIYLASLCHPSELGFTYFILRRRIWRR